MQYIIKLVKLCQEMEFDEDWEIQMRETSRKTYENIRREQYQWIANQAVNPEFKDAMRNTVDN